MTKSAFSNVLQKKSAFQFNYYQLNLQINELIDKLNSTTNQTLIRIYFRKIYILIHSSRLPPEIMKLCSELLNTIKGILFVNTNIPDTIIYCMIVPN
jgi:hypothetical protein